MEKDIYEAAKKLADIMLEKKKTFVTAESCTGGWIAKSVTDIAGISSVFLGGIVSYANEIKEKLLSVSAETLGKHGAVSEETACEMAAGAINSCGADYSVAVTGIAGPGGGTAEKPVGLVYIACAGKNGGCYAEKNIFSGSREDVRKSTVKKALEMLAEFVEKADTDKRFCGKPC